jgi:hypothetical protein
MTDPPPGSRIPRRQGNSVPDPRPQGAAGSGQNPTAAAAASEQRDEARGSPPLGKRTKATAMAPALPDLARISPDSAQRLEAAAKSHRRPKRRGPNLSPRPQSRRGRGPQTCYLFVPTPGDPPGCGQSNGGGAPGGRVPNRLPSRQSRRGVS